MNRPQGILLCPRGIHEGRYAVIVRSETSRRWIERTGRVRFLLECGKHTRSCGSVAHKMRWWLVAAERVLSNHRGERYKVLLHDRLDRCSNRCGRERYVPQNVQCDPIAVWACCFSLESSL